MAGQPASTSTAGRKAALKAGRALPPASPGGPPGFPINSGTDWENARKAVGRVKNPARRARVAGLLRKTAPKFGKAKALGQSWAAQGGSSGGSKSYANAGPGGLLMAFTGDSDESGRTGTCPACGHSGPMSSFSGNTLSPPSTKPGELRTPTGNVNRSIAGMNPGQIPVRSTGPGSHALANAGGRSIGLAYKMPVTSAMDIVVSRQAGGRARVVHRRAGTVIGDIWHGDDGKWHSSPEGGNELAAHTHQRGALVELLGTHNRASIRPDRWAQPLPAAQAPQQTPLMAAYGVQAVRALANDGGSGDGGQPGASAGGPAGLSPRGQAIYKKLIAKGFPAARAMAFAKNSQNTKPGQFGRKAS